MADVPEHQQASQENVTTPTVRTVEKQNTNNVMVKTPWTHPKLQGDDEEHSGFGFPTVTYTEPVEMTPEQYEIAKKVARVHRFRLKEVR